MSLTYLENRHNIHDSPWREDLIERLKVLWSEGLSASQIADNLGSKFTRMSVLGKVHRLGLQGRVARQLVPGAPRKSKRRPRPPKWRPPPSRPIPPPAPTAPHMRELTIFELRPSHCRWPVADGPYLFCA